VSAPEKPKQQASEPDASACRQAEPASQAARYEAERYEAQALRRLGALAAMRPSAPDRRKYGSPGIHAFAVAAGFVAATSAAKGRANMKFIQDPFPVGLGVCTSVRRRPSTTTGTSAPVSVAIGPEFLKHQPRRNGRSDRP